MAHNFREVRPTTADYAPYYDKYVSKVPDGDLVATLASQQADTLALLKSISEEQAMFAYAPDKWTLKQVLGHMIDTERLFGFRALWFARNGGAPMPSMEQNDWAEVGGHNLRSWSSLVDEFAHLRVSSLDMFGAFDEVMWLRRGIASNYEVTVGGLAWITTGHERHHVGVVRAKYLLK